MPNRACDICHATPATPFLWTYKSQREGERVRTHHFCQACESRTRHMCTGSVAQKMLAYEAGYPVRIEQTYEGIVTHIADGKRGPSRDAEKPHRDVVYIIQAKGTYRFKIGQTSAWPARLEALQTASPYPLEVFRIIPTEHAGALEAMLHRRYASYRKHREWFELPLRVLRDLLSEDFTSENDHP
jgi:hypothetical protein